MKKLSKYEVLERLGTGGMGSIYRARDPVLERDVAIKTIVTGGNADAELMQRFYREARACARLQHPNIVTIYDLGEQDDLVYIVMELLVGADLLRIIAERREMPPETKIDLIAQVADGLGHAHANGIIHRDIKPSNVFIQEGNRAKILDFGVARIAASQLTRAGMALGTPAYMAPEQLAGKVCDARSDLFSAAIVFFEFLAYEHPFDGRNIMRSIASERAASLRSVNPDLPETLEKVIAKGLEKQPERRYQNAVEFAAALRGALAQPAETQRDLDFEAPKEPQGEPAPPSPEADSIVKALRLRARQLLEQDCLACLAFVESLGQRQKSDPEIARIREKAEAVVKGGPGAPPKTPSPDLPSSPFVAAAPGRRGATSASDAVTQRTSSVAATVATPRPSVPEPPAPHPPPTLPAIPRPVLKPLTPATPSEVLPQAELPQSRKRIVAAVAIALLTIVSLFAYNLRFRSNRVLPAVAHGEVIGPEARILAAPGPDAQLVLIARQGDRLNLLDLPRSRGEQWIRVQRVTGRKGSSPGYVKAAEIGNWSSESATSLLYLLKVFGPSEKASPAELKAQLEKLNAFTDQFGIAPEGPEGNFEKAKLYLALARLGRQSGLPASDWQGHLDAATGQLAMASANPELAFRVWQARQDLEELRRAAEEPPPPPRRGRPRRSSRYNSR